MKGGVWTAILLYEELFMDFEQIDELAGMEMKTPGAEESETCPICGGVNALPQADIERLNTYFPREDRNLFLWSRSEERRVGKECRSRWSPYH